MGKPLEDVIKKMDGRKAANLLGKYDAIELLAWVEHLRDRLNESEGQTQHDIESARRFTISLEQSLTRLRAAAITHPEMTPQNIDVSATSGRVACHDSETALSLSGGSTRDSGAPVEPETKPHGAFDPSRARRRPPAV